MKKSLLAVVAALAIAGCSQTEIDGIDSKQDGKVAIKFNTAVGKSSRAVDYVTNNLQTDGMKVYSYISDQAVADYSTLYMDGAAYTYNASNWSSTNTYYWPKDKYMHFIAIPATYSYANKSITATDRTDLVAALATGQNGGSNGEVELKFDHILTKINFETSLSETTDNTLTIDITEIKLSGFKGQGQCTYDVTSKIWDLTNASDITNQVYTPTQSLMLYPQTFTTDPTVVVTYNVKQTIGDKTTTIISAGTKTASIPTNSVKWEAGKNIKYTLAIPFTGQKMTVTASVNDWVDPANGDTPT